MGFIENLHPRLNYLVPNPVYGLNEPFNTYESIVWNDSRVLPAEADLLAITNEQLLQAVKDAELAAVSNDMNIDKWKRFLFEIHYNAENRIRVLEGKATITKSQYKNALLDLYKSLA